MSEQTCKTCKISKSLDKFPRYAGVKKRTKTHRPHCKRCTYERDIKGRSEERKEELRAYHRAYHRANPLNAKVKSYQHFDKQNGFKSILLKQARDLIEKHNCFYCDSSNLLGLDRIDCSKGHSEDNVVVCCEKCNFILGDLPQAAKNLLKSGLKQIKTQELLEKWTIPTKRKPRGEK